LLKELQLLTFFQLFAPYSFKFLSKQYWLLISFDLKEFFVFQLLLKVHQQFFGRRQVFSDLHEDASIDHHLMPIFY